MPLKNKSKPAVISPMNSEQSAISNLAIFLGTHYGTMSNNHNPQRFLCTCLQQWHAIDTTLNENAKERFYQLLVALPATTWACEDITNRTSPFAHALAVIDPNAEGANPASGQAFINNVIAYLPLALQLNFVMTALHKGGPTIKTLLKTPFFLNLHTHITATKDLYECIPLESNQHLYLNMLLQIANRPPRIMQPVIKSTENLLFALCHKAASVLPENPEQRKRLWQARKGDFHPTQHKTWSALQLVGLRLNFIRCQNPSAATNRLFRRNTDLELKWLELNNKINQLFDIHNTENSTETDTLSNKGVALDAYQQASNLLAPPQNCTIL